MLNYRANAVLMLGLFSILIGAPPATAQRLTQDQAVRIASDFCKRLGEPTSVQPSAQFPLPVAAVPLEPLYWQPAWLVNFRGEAEVHVSDADGIVVFYYNDKLGWNLGNRPAGEPIPQLDAIQKAEAALRETGQAEDLTFDRVTLMKACKDAACQDWYVRWSRSIGGITYKDQAATVAVQADTGRITVLCLGYPTAPPTPSTAMVSQDLAEATAQMQLAAVGWAGKTFLQNKMELKVVRPNTFWLNGNERPAVSYSRIAWVRSFGWKGNLVEVWVDRETGVILGGYWMGPTLALGSGGAKWRDLFTPHSLLKELQGAREVGLYRREGKADWSKTPAATLSETSHPELLLQLNKITQPYKTRKMPAVRYRLQFHAEGATDDQALYVPEEGIVGKPGEWYAVPAKVNAWLKKAALADGTGVAASSANGQ